MRVTPKPQNPKTPKPQNPNSKFYFCFLLPYLRIRSDWAFIRAFISSHSCCSSFSHFLAKNGEMYLLDFFFRLLGFGVFVLAGVKDWWEFKKCMTLRGCGILASGGTVAGVGIAWSISDSILIDLESGVVMRRFLRSKLRADLGLLFFFTFLTCLDAL